MARSIGQRRLASLIRGVCATCLLGASLASDMPAREVDLDSFGNLEGHVHVLDGRHARVMLVRDDMRIADAKLEPNGSFRFPAVPAGRYTLLVRGDWCGPLELPITVTEGAVDWIEVDLPCSPIPCPRLDKSDPGCIMPNPRERARVGSTCDVHRKRRLRLDVVPIRYGIMGFQPAGGDAQKQFPNASVVESMGCVVGVERWAEVAYCQDCRAAFFWHNPLYLLLPIQPHEIDRRWK